MQKASNISFDVVIDVILNTNKLSVIGGGHDVHVMSL